MRLKTCHSLLLSFHLLLALLNMLYKDSVARCFLAHEILPHRKHSHAFQSTSFKLAPQNKDGEPGKASLLGGRVFLQECGTAKSV